MKDFFNSDSKAIYELILKDVDEADYIEDDVVVRVTATALDYAVAQKDSTKVLDCLKKNIYANVPNAVARFLLETKDHNQYESMHYFYEQQFSLEMKSKARVTSTNFQKIECEYALLKKEIESQILNLMSNTLVSVPIDLIKIMMVYDSPFLHDRQITFFAEKKEELKIDVTAEEAACCRIL